MIPKLILVSSSPRRIELLKKLKFNFEVLRPRVEVEEKHVRPHEAVIINAERKVKSVITPNLRGIFIGVDTIVYIDREILGKPKGIDEAKWMLKKLSGRKHHVYSGIYLYDTYKSISKSTYVKTQVLFKELEEEEIDWYISTGEPFDKAGAYGIQGYASLFITEIKGSYYNVLGFPIEAFYRLLTEMGYNPLNFINLETTHRKY